MKNFICIFSVGLMAGLKEDPILGIDGITIKEELEIGKPEIDRSREDHPVLETGGAVIKGESLINNRSVIDKVREEGSCGQGERDMVPPISNSIHRSGSRPQLDLSKAAIEGTFEERDPTILLPNQSDDISHLALDIGGRSYSLFTCALLSVFFFPSFWWLNYVFLFLFLHGSCVFALVVVN